MSERGQLVWRLVPWMVVLAVVVISGRTVYREQSAALEQCAPQCDLIGVAGAAIETVFAAAVAVPMFSAWGLPVGILLSVLFLLWLLQHVRVDPI
jgi:hypothetical protein